MNMDQEQRIAEELNRGCYSANLCQYFSATTGDDLTSDSEPELEDEEEIDVSDCITLENIPNLQLTLAEDEDDEEALGLVAEELLEREISDAISTVTFEGKKDRELEKIRNFDCKCYGRRKEDSLLGTQSCSRRLPPELMYNIRMDSLAAEKHWQDMRIIGHLEANRRTVVTSQMTTSRKRPAIKRKSPRTTYLIGGNEVCRNTFQFLMGIGKDKLTDIIKHFDVNGARPRVRKNSPRPPSPKFIGRKQIDGAVEFIKNYAEDNAIMLPGRHFGHRDWHVKLLPTRVSKATVWRLYMRSAKELGERAVCKSSFKALWNQLLPHIRCGMPSTALCGQCQQNTEQLVRSANLPDERKSEAVKKQQDHLALVQKERAAYNEMTAACRQTCADSRLSFGPSPPASKKIRMHYNFDFAQQMHFPSNPLQPGLMYFLTPRKCGLFGVSCEGLQKQVNFLTDEGRSSSKGSDEAISYIHHFFGKFGVGETDVDLHCDNCTGLHKNNSMLWYGAWRVAHKLHSTLSMHFLMVGHTKLAPDCGFGLIKQEFMKTRVNTLEDIAQVVENSSPESGLNIPQLVGTADGRAIVKTFDWQTHLSPYFRKLPQIKSYQHFSFNTNRPGVVLARTHSDAEPIEFQLLHKPGVLPPVDGLPVLAPPGLTMDRQTYLFEKIRPFCSDEAKDITCPAPQHGHSKFRAPKSKRRRV
ncbi:hypothetical protein JOB18_007261 [Solea senegalensis]|uniref:DUF7869 domain-containing protein n=2 Tax=Solea senegalensis TaxID=28829 RepID=A0AAV6Q0R6_SOLSE|nr:uncharacterized protein LOC122772551 [Solea senegalensis]KAG7481875.1 hypothetical protein JOB18_007261 [Solea senegalensis]